MNKIITIGRSQQCDIIIDQSYTRVSSEHATIEALNDQFIFRDKSTNGTTINGALINDASTIIHQEDVIVLANSYRLKWSEIISNFPSLQKRTEKIESVQSSFANNNRTEVIDTTDSQRQSTLTGESTIGELNAYTQSEIEGYSEKFSIGAFLSSWVWALFHGIYWPLAIIPISLIPYIGQIASLFLCSYLGIKGNSISWERSDLSFGKFIANQKRWSIVGCFIFPLFFTIQFIVFYYILS